MPIHSKIAPPIATSQSPAVNVADETAPTQGKKSLLKAIIRWLIALIVIAALAVAVKQSIDHWHSQTQESRLRLADLQPRWLLASAFLYALGLFPAAVVLSRALRSLGVSLPLRAVASAQIIGHLGKYVPGKAMVVVLRAAVLNRGGLSVSLRAATIAITIETLTLIATGASLSLIVVMFLDAPPWIRTTGGVVAIGALVATWPPLLRLAISRRIVGGTLSFDWTTNDMVAAWFWNAVSWGLFGGSLMAVILALPESFRNEAFSDPISLYFVCFASLALAFVAGFLSFLPGGAIAREVVLTTMLTPVTGTSTALIAAILLRMIHLAVEILLAGVAWKALPQQDEVTTRDMDVLP
jgi:glycosyltransferase 2 family protein